MIELSARSAFSFSWQDNPAAWLLREGDRGQKSVPVKPLPFVIGRSLDCELVLPHNADLSRTTSRWHCHFIQEGKSILVADGSAKAVPETGRRKPSITGTFLNGTRIERPEPVKKGDVLTVGPWEFSIGQIRETSVDIDGLLRRIGAESPRTIDERDPALVKGFGQLHELYSRLNETYDQDESLLAILRFAMSKIKAAQVAAIMVDSPGAGPAVRMAWQRDSGRILDFHFSSGLVKGMPLERAFLLKASIQDGTKSQLEQNISSGLVVPLRGSRGRLGLFYMDNRNSGMSFSEDDLYLANALASVASLQLALERQAFLVNVELNMRQYFGPEVARLIAEESKKGKPVSLGVRECEATILFFDLEGFAAFCRGKTPEQIGDLLNPYFELAAESIQRHGGHVDKFIGDGVLGVFGAQPIQGAANSRDPNHAACAVRAAREMITAWAKRGSPIPLRAGLNTGSVIIGNIGYPGRMEYSVLGDTVNLASRLEHLAKPNAIVLSEATCQRVLGECEAVADGEAEVKGYGKVKVWRVSVPAHG